MRSIAEVATHVSQMTVNQRTLCEYGISQWCCSGRMKPNYRFTCQPGKEQNALPSVYKSLCRKIDAAYPENPAPQAFVQYNARKSLDRTKTMNAQDATTNSVNSISTGTTIASPMQSGENQAHTVLQQNIQYQQPQKKKHGCLIGCGVTLGLFIIPCNWGHWGAPIFFINNDFCAGTKPLPIHGPEFQNRRGRGG